MQKSRQAFRAGSMLIVGGVVFGTLLILSQEVHALKYASPQISAGSVTLGNPNNPTCTVTVDSLEAQASAQMHEQIWKTILACEAAQGGTPQQKVPDSAPDLVPEIPNELET